MRQFRTLLIGVAIAIALGGALAQAQDNYPSRPVLLTHGFGAGGNADTVARIIAPALSERLGQQVVVEPRTGAGGNLASDRAAKARARWLHAHPAHRGTRGFRRALQAAAIRSGR